VRALLLVAPLLIACPEIQREPRPIDPKEIVMKEVKTGTQAAQPGIQAAPGSLSPARALQNELRPQGAQLPVPRALREEEAPRVVPEESLR